MRREQAFEHLQKTSKPVVASLNKYKPGDIIHNILVLGERIDHPFCVVREVTVEDWLAQFDDIILRKAQRAIIADRDKGLTLYFYETSVD